MLVSGTPRPLVLALFDSGARVSVVEREGRLVAWIWERAGQHDTRDGVRFRLLADEVWWFDGWVAREYRGRGILRQLMNFHAGECAGAGYTRILLVADVLNRNSLSATTAFGFERVGSLSRISVLGLSLVRAGGTTRIGRWSSAHPLVIASELLLRGE